MRNSWILHLHATYACPNACPCSMMFLHTDSPPVTDCLRAMLMVFCSVVRETYGTYTGAYRTT